MKGSYTLRESEILRKVAGQTATAHGLIDAEFHDRAISSRDLMTAWDLVRGALSGPDSFMVREISSAVERAQRTIVDGVEAVGELDKRLEKLEKLVKGKKGKKKNGKGCK